MGGCLYRHFSEHLTFYHSITSIIGYVECKETRRKNGGGKKFNFLITLRSAFLVIFWMDY